MTLWGHFYIPVPGLVLMGVIVWLLSSRVASARVDVCKRKGDYDGALRWMHWATLGYPSARSLCSEALILSQAGRLMEAERLCRRAIAMKGGSAYPRAQALLGFILMDAGRYALAEQSYREAVHAGDPMGIAHSGLAELLLVQGVDAERALASTDRGIELAQQDERGLVHWAHYANRAWALGLLGRGDEARESLRRALSVPYGRPTASGTAELHWRVGMALVAMRYTNEACHHFQLGKDVDPRGKYGKRCSETLRKTE